MWPRAILLDFYGTVVQEDDVPVLRICEEIALAAGNAAPQQVASYWSRRFAELCHDSHGARFRLQKELELRSLQDTLGRFQAALNAQELSQRLYDYWRRPAVLPDVRAVLGRCPVPICLVSNIDNAELRAALGHCRLSFTWVVTSEDCRAYKPHPAPFRRALELLGVAPQDVLHVGDSLGSDVQGAKALGIPVLWINRKGRVPSAEEEQPDYIAADLTGILAVTGTR